jgi:hypothetical protein
MSRILSNLWLPAYRRTASFVVAMAMVSVLSFFSGHDVSAQGNLLITPRRAVFEGNSRSLDLNLANTGSDTATYAISIIQIRMTEEGGFETITEPDPGQLFADRYIRFFPRQVTLGPNEAQVVKVQTINTNGLKPGEYRSHFYFRAVPKAKPLGTDEPVRDNTGISVVLTPVFGITIPVIIRVGESSTSVSLTDLSVEKVAGSDLVLKMILRRSGNISVYGDLAIDHVSTSGTVTRVGAANGLAVYTPNTMRKFQMNLIAVPGVDFSSGKLHIMFSAPSDVKPERYADAELMLR